jgi:glycosyltransferase involved in cell wall biosynthesis
MAAPQFSVIIPTRNRPQYLEQSIASALDQQDADIEVLVINDGSEPPPTFKDRRVTILDNGERGAVVARNLGVRQARGRLIAFLDDDDWWCDTFHLQRAQRALDAGAEFTFADGIMRYMNGDPDLAFAFDADSRTLTRDNTILISSICYRRSLHDTLGMFDEALPFYWDWDWYLRVARSGRMMQRLTPASVIIRVHAGNMSGAGAIQARQANLDALAIKHNLAQLTLKNHDSLAHETSTRY